jgi:hypothetical protein
MQIIVDFYCLILVLNEDKTYKCEMLSGLPGGILSYCSEFNNLEASVTSGAGVRIMIFAYMGL